MDRLIAFSEHYKNNLFKGKESKSGTGSDPEQTKILKLEIINLCKQLNIKTLVDAPCGDVFWMRDIWSDLKLDKYCGIDIVPDLIKNNEQSFGSTNISFKVLDLVESIIPIKFDLLLCRDCLVHLSYASTKKILKNFASSNIKYFALTTFTNEDRKNYDWEDGTNWYPICLTKEPFNLTTPKILINEHCTEVNGEFQDKHLGIWTREELIQCGY